MFSLFRVLMAGLLASAVGVSQAAAQGAAPRVVVTSKPIHALVAEVMRDVGAPDLLVDGNASPHTYSMRPSDAKRVNRAEVFFRISEGLEPFTAKIVRALPRSVRVSTLAEAPGVKHLPRRAGGAFEVRKRGHSHGHGHSHDHGSHAKSAYDAHVWLDPDNAKAMTAAIAAVLAERAPAHAARFRANAEALSVRLDDLGRKLAADLAPVGSRPFVVLHDAYQYLEHRFGLNAVGSILVDPDEQPSAKRISDLRKRVASLGAVCVFAEPGHHPRTISSVIEGTRSRTAVLDPEGTALTPGPNLYFELMSGLATAMKDCLATPA
jgi:zinc transport system substrate-binding protein